MVVFRTVIFVSLYSSVCGVVLSQNSSMQRTSRLNPFLITEVARSQNLFRHFDLVLADVDGTLNAHHPEQNDAGDGYNPKEQLPIPGNPVVAYTKRRADGPPTGSEKSPPEKRKVSDISKTGFANNYWIGTDDYAIYHFDEDLMDENQLFARQNFGPLGEKFFYFIAASGWSIEQYAQSLPLMGLPGTGTVFDASKKKSFSTNEDGTRGAETEDRRWQSVKATDCGVKGGPGGDYLAKANTIRQIVECPFARAETIEGCDGGQFINGGGKKSQLDNYEIDYSSDLSCDRLHNALMIDDCPFTMSAYRVHLEDTLPGLATLFIAPHLSIFNDPDTLQFLEATKTNKALWKEQIVERDPPYNQYSSGKPAMGVDAAKQIRGCKNNPRVGQSVYYINRIGGGAGSGSGAAAAMDVPDLSDALE